VRERERETWGSERASERECVCVCERERGRERETWDSEGGREIEREREG